MEVSLEMCRVAAEDGTGTIIATPHMLNGLYDVSCEMVTRGVQELQRAVEEAALPLRILPGADVHVARDLADYLARGEVMTVADRGAHLLLELPQDVVPRELADVLFQVQLKGITPIISHPERNIEIQSRPELLDGLIEAGSLTQVTAGSLAGAFGRRAHRSALRLLRSGRLHLVASDAHNPGRRSPRLSEARRVVGEELGEEAAVRIFDERPARIVAGEHVEPPEPLEQKRAGGKRIGFLRRLLSGA